MIRINLLHSQDRGAATRDAAILLRLRVDFMTRWPTAADVWLMNAALHVEGRSDNTVIRASQLWPDARDTTPAR